MLRIAQSKWRCGRKIYSKQSSSMLSLIGHHFLSIVLNCQLDLGLNVDWLILTHASLYSKSFHSDWMMESELLPQSQVFCCA